MHDKRQQPDKRAHVPFTARLHSASAADFSTSTDGDARSAMSGGTAPAATFVILHSAYAADFSTLTDGDASSAMSGGTAPAAAIVILFASAEHTQ